MFQSHNLSRLLPLALVGIFCFAASSQAQQKNSDPTPRTFMTPQAASKVRVYEAKQRKMFGLETQTLVDRSTQTGASGAAKSCNTNIGPSLSAQNTTASGTGRYGPGQSARDSTVIVTGDVINVCK
jgi:hypothetical protein